MHYGWIGNCEKGQCWFDIRSAMLCQVSHSLDQYFMYPQWMSDVFGRLKMNLDSGFHSLLFITRVWCTVSEYVHCVRLSA